MKYTITYFIIFQIIIVTLKLRYKLTSSTQFMIIWYKFYMNI